MATRYSAEMFGKHFQVLEIVFENISSRQYTRTQKESFCAHVSIAMFPGLMRRHQWEVFNRSNITAPREELFPMYISLGDSATYWFMNLRLLQIRIRLGLRDYYYLQLGFVTIRMSEVMCKLNVLARLIGQERLFCNYRPRLRPVRVVRDYPRMAIRRRAR